MGSCQAPFTWTMSLTDQDQGQSWKWAHRKYWKPQGKSVSLPAWRLLLECVYDISHPPSRGSVSDSQKTQSTNCRSARITPQEPGFTEDLHKSSCGACLCPTGSNHYDSNKNIFCTKGQRNHFKYENVLYRLIVYRAFAHWESRVALQRGFSDSWCTLPWSTSTTGLIYLFMHFYKNS